MIQLMHVLISLPFPGDRDRKGNRQRDNNTRDKE